MRPAGAIERTCPYCAETIKAAAIRCRFCFAELREDGVQADETPLRESESVSNLACSEIEDILSRLVGQSLVIFDDSTGRYRLLDTVRQYADEQLSGSHEAEVCRDRHLACYVVFCEQTSVHLRTPRQSPWLAQLDYERENIRNALDWGATNGETRSILGMRLMLRAVWLWLARGCAREDRDRMEKVLTVISHAPPGLRADVLGAAGSLAMYSGDLETSRARFEESLITRRNLGDLSGVADSLSSLANVASDEGDLKRARALNDESIAIRRQLGERQKVAYSLNNLGVIALDMCDFEQARDLFAESLELRREFGDGFGEGLTLSNLAIALHALGEKSRASDLRKQSLAIRKELGDWWGTAYLLESLAEAAVDDLEHYHAAVLAGAADALRNSISATLPQSDRIRHDEKMAIPRKALGGASFAAAFAEGSSMCGQSAIEYALEHC